MTSTPSYPIGTPGKDWGEDERILEEIDKNFEDRRLDYQAVPISFGTRKEYAEHLCRTLARRCQLLEAGLYLRQSETSCA